MTNRAPIRLLGLLGLSLTIGPVAAVGEEDHGLQCAAYLDAVTVSADAIPGTSVSLLGRIQRLGPAVSRLAAGLRAMKAPPASPEQAAKPVPWQSVQVMIDRISVDSEYATRWLSANSELVAAARGLLSLDDDLLSLWLDDAMVGRLAVMRADGRSLVFLEGGLMQSLVDLSDADSVRIQCVDGRLRVEAYGGGLGLPRPGAFVFSFRTDRLPAAPAVPNTCRHKSRLFDLSELAAK